MGFFSAIGSSFLDSAGSSIGGNIGAVDYAINPLAQWGYDKLWSAQRENSIENARAAYDLQLEYLPKYVKGQRDALVAAGYNPIMAVSSASGQPMSNQLPATDGLGSPSRSSGYYENAAKAALIEQTNAQTDFIKRRTLGEGWVVKTLTASEARGLGANFARTLGFHFNGSDSQTFLVAYNPITGEMRNIANTDSLGSTGETNDAATVRAQFDDDAPVTFHYRRGESSPYRSSYDHTSRFNLPR